MISSLGAVKSRTQVSAGLISLDFFRLNFLISEGERGFKGSRRRKKQLVSFARERREFRRFLLSEVGP